MESRDPAAAPAREKWKRLSAVLLRYSLQFKSRWLEVSEHISTAATPTLLLLLRHLLPHARLQELCIPAHRATAAASLQRTRHRHVLNTQHS